MPKQHQQPVTTSPLDSSMTTQAGSPVHVGSVTDGKRADRIWMQQQIADRQKLKQSLPAPLRLGYEHIVEPLFPPGEPFDLYMRKVAVATFAAMASNSPILVIWITILASLDEHGWNSRRIASLTISSQVSIQLAFLNYLYMRMTRKCPEWLANLAVFGAEMTFVQMSLFLPEVDVRTIILCSMLLVALMSLRLFPLHAAIHGAIYAFDYFRSTYRTEIPQLVFSWDSDGNSMSEKAIYTFLSFAPQATAAFGVYVIISGYIRRNKEAQTTNIMTITIADQLQRYDTKAVDATIKEHKEQVNEKLVDAFDAIRTNLESYRPHIPRYLIDAAVERAEEAEARELRAMASSLADFETDDEGSIASGRGGAAGSASGGSVQSRSNSTLGSSQRRTMCTPTDHSIGSTTTQNFVGIVTSVYLRILCTAEGSPTSNCSPSMLNKAIEEINVIAASTMASVHHIEQGIMLVTWNATKRTANHEIRACTFADKAMAALQAYDGIRECAAAAVLSCKATAYFAGTSQMHFVLSHDDVQRHLDLLGMAQHHKTVVCTPSIARNAEMQFVFMGFAADCKKKLVYELVEPRASNGDEDEWLYAINVHDRDATNPYSRITTAAALKFMDVGDITTIKHLPGVCLEENMEKKNMGSENLLKLTDVPEKLRNRSTVQELLDEKP